jgi:hypothetical protein
METGFPIGSCSKELAHWSPMMVARGLMSSLSLEIEDDVASQTVVIPAKAGIQYAAALMIDRDASGILDHPLSRMMTVVGKLTPPA